MAFVSFERKNIVNEIKDDLKFLKGWIKNPVVVGSIKPTSKPAAKHMAMQIPLETDLPVLELGPGTGVITKELLNRGLEPEKLVSIEYSQSFYEDLKNRYPGVNFVRGDAFNLAATLEPLGYEKFSGIICAIPLLNVPMSKRIQIIEDGLKFISGSGPFIQLCYGPKPPVEPIAGKFAASKTGRIYRNLPPAGIWAYRRDCL